MRRLTLIGLLLLAFATPAAAAPEGTLTWGVHVTLATRRALLADAYEKLKPCIDAHEAMAGVAPAGDDPEE